MKSIFYTIIPLSCILQVACCDPNRHGPDSRHAWLEYQRISPFQRPADQIDFNLLASQIKNVQDRHPDTFVSPHLNRVEAWCLESPIALANAKRKSDLARSSALNGRDALLDVGEVGGKLLSDKPQGSFGNEVDGQIGRGVAWLGTELHASSVADRAFRIAMQPHKRVYESLIKDEAYLSLENCMPISQELQFQINEIGQ